MKIKVLEFGKPTLTGRVYSKKQAQPLVESLSKNGLTVWIEGNIMYCKINKGHSWQDLSNSVSKHELYTDLSENKDAENKLKNLGSQYLTWPSSFLNKASDELDSIRKEIQNIDNSILELYNKRQKLAEQVALIKFNRRLQIYNKNLEDRKLSQAKPEERELLLFLMKKSKEHQIATIQERVRELQNL